MPWIGNLYRKWNYSTSGWTGDAASSIGIEAGRHDSQDDDFANGINSCLNKAGANAATGNIDLGNNKIINVAAGTSSTDAANFGQIGTAISAAMPTGSITMYAASSAPSGFLLCNGDPVSRSSYSTLFGIIGTTYGSGDGLTTFNLPNLTQRFPLGKATSGTGASLGSTGGAIDHSHSVPAHYHGMGTGSTAAVDISHTHAASSVTGTIGPSGAHSHTEAACNTGTSGTAPIDRIQITGRAGAATATVSIASTSSDHSHAVTAGMLSAAGQTLSTTSKSVTGTVGLVTGGVDGNAAMTSGTNNPPFLVVNFIIKT